MSYGYVLSQNLPPGLYLAEYPRRVEPQGKLDLAVGLGVVDVRCATAEVVMLDPARLVAGPGNGPTA